MRNFLASTKTHRVLIATFIVLSVLTVYQILSTQGVKTDLSTIRSQIKSLCTTGALNCEGTKGLPGHTGIAGTGIQRIACNETTGLFHVVYTNGREDNFGDCVARDGTDGQDGARGPQGRPGVAGQTGAIGPRGPAGANGKDGAPGGVTIKQVRNLIEGMTSKFVTRADVIEIIQQLCKGKPAGVGLC